MKIWSRTKQKDVDHKDLPLKDLIYILDHIGIDVSDCWMPDTEKKEGYAAIDEAIRRLKKYEKKCADITSNDSMSGNKKEKSDG